MAIARTLTFLPFYVAGYRAKQMGWTLPRNRWTRVAAVVAFGLVLAALLAGVLRVSPELLFGRGPYRGLHLTGAPAGVIRLGLLMLGGVLVVAFMQFVPARKSVLTVLGVTTLSVYAWHALVVRNIKFYDLTDFFAGTLVAVLLTTAVLVLVLGYGPIPRLTSIMAGAPFKKRGA
jgi:fucose 4-O-acetylase-like acetyltransferase